MSTGAGNGRSMVETFGGNWWAVALRGVAAVVFGLLALLWPEITLVVLILFFGAYALVDGVFALVTGIRRAGGGQRWVLILEGVIGILAGLIAFAWPGITALALLYVIAFWAIFSGVSRIIAAIALRREIQNELLIIISGVLAVILGILLAILPFVGLLSLVWLIGIYALIAGIMLIVFAFRVRRMRGRQGERRVT